MKKNGFTLIELIGTIVILTVILLLIMPEVTKRVKDASKDADKQTIENIELAAKNYASDNKGETCVTVQKLMNEGYLDLNDPKKEAEHKSKSVKITKQKKVYEAEYGGC